MPFFPSILYTVMRLQPLKRWIWKLKGERIACYTRLSPIQYQPGTIQFGHRITRVVPHGQVWAVWGKPQSIPVRQYKGMKAMKKRRPAQKGMDEKGIVMSDLKRMVIWIVIAVAVTGAGALWMELWR